MTRGRAATGLAVAVAVVAVLVWAARGARERGVACGGGFVAAGARCCDTSASDRGVCARSTPPPQRMIRVPDTHLVVGPSDWEAEGRVAPRAIDVRAFYIDAYEGNVTAGEDRARALGGLSFAEAGDYCRARGKRLPTEDEWIAAAAGPTARRYPWGDTGAVCRRAAWGLATGPCARASSEQPAGPDSIGAHPDGRTPLGIEDMAGNVAEWSVSPAGPVAHGGSWQSALATELRTWARLEVDPSAHDPRLGVRCASDGDAEGSDAGVR
ncbi:MAG: formylglycine-generating enzyme family protein [Polyangiaceae bacterium]